MLAGDVTSRDVIVKDVILNVGEAWVGPLLHRTVSMT